MSEREDKREHSTKPEVDDLTDYQSLNSLGGAGVRVRAEEIPAPINPREEPAADPKPAPDVIPAGEYNDGAEIDPVDNEANTNA